MIFDKLFRNKEKIDPTKTSVLANNLELKKIENTISKKSITGIYKDKKSGEIFYKKENKNFGQMAQFEYFISLFSKGILHVSDMIKHDNNFYSREMNLEHIEEKSTEEEMESELFILNYVFGDADHCIDNHMFKDNVINFRVKNGKFVHYDYGLAFNKDFIDKNININKSEEYKMIQRKLGYYTRDDYSNFNNDFFLQCVLNKSQQFLTLLNDNSFFNNVFKKAELNIQDIISNKGETLENKEVLFNLIKNRFVLLKEFIENRLIKDK